MKTLIFVLACLLPTLAFSGCLDNLTTSTTIHSKVRGFYINKALSNDQKHFVILDKGTCRASQSGDVTLLPVTLSHYYLQFSSADKTLYSSLLTAQAKGVTVEFRMDPSLKTGRFNSIAYIVTPSGARSQ